MVRRRGEDVDTVFMKNEKFFLMKKQLRTSILKLSFPRVSDFERTAFKDVIMIFQTENIP